MNSVQVPHKTESDQDHTSHAVISVELPDNILTVTNTQLEPVNNFAETQDYILKVTEGSYEEIGEEEDISQAWFTSKIDKDSFQDKGFSWRQGQWAKDEVEVLQNNIENYCRERNISNPSEIIFEMTKEERKDFYRIVARGLRRPLFSVYRRVVRMYDIKNHIGKYKPEEVEKLKRLYSKYGTDWATIGEALGRSASSVKDRFRLIKDTCNRGKWMTPEENRLMQAVYELSGHSPGDNIIHGISWAAVSEKVRTRSEKQCRTKWLNYLNWKQKGGTEWTQEDDQDLVLRIYNSGALYESDIDWVELANGWKSARSPQWLRGKWWTIKRHVENYSNIPFRELVERMRDQYVYKVLLKTGISIDGSGLSETTESKTIQLPVHLQSVNNTDEKSTSFSIVLDSNVIEDQSSLIDRKGFLKEEDISNLTAVLNSDGTLVLSRPSDISIKTNETPPKYTLSDSSCQVNSQSTNSSMNRQKVDDKKPVAESFSDNDPESESLSLNNVSLDSINESVEVPPAVILLDHSSLIEEQNALSEEHCYAGLAPDSVIEMHKNISRQPLSRTTIENDPMILDDKTIKSIAAEASGNSLILVQNTSESYIAQDTEHFEQTNPPVIALSSLSDPMLPTDHRENADLLEAT